MQAKMSRKFVGVILGNGMRNQLHPITMNFPISNLPVGNKKLIVHQLEQLQSIDDMDTIIVVYSQDSIKLKQFLDTEFIPNNPQYPHAISFFRVENGLSEYSSLQKLFTETAYDGFDEVKGAIIVPRDLISSIKLSSVLAEHIEKESDVTMLLKQKKQYGKDEKKPEFDCEPQVDIAMMNLKSEIFALRSIENYQYLGFSLPASVYQRVAMASFQKVIDMRVYVFGPRVIKIVKHLQNEELCNLKDDFIDIVIRNQNNSTLLDHTRDKTNKPLKIGGKVAGQNQYVRSLININIFESVNLDSLIRGPKQKDPLMPTAFTPPMDEKYMSDFRGCIIGKGCEIEAGNKMTRNVIQRNCRIGKGVQMSNCILMAGTVIQDGCKISNSIIGPNCLIRSQSIINFCQFAMGCVVEKGSNIEKQLIIPAQ